MGGGDLNLKKSWHPATLKNQERVWKAEQLDSAEKKRIQELQREINEERNREELQKQGESSGVLQRNSHAGDVKLDWMYKDLNQQVNREDYLLGRQVDKAFDQLVENEKSGNQVTTIPYDPNKNHVEHECIPPSIRDLKNTAATTEQVDIARKLQEDPLIEIRKREIEARKQVLQNPVKLKQIQKLLSEKKKSKKSKKHKRKHQSDSSDSELDHKLLEKYEKLKSKLKRKRDDETEDLDQILTDKYSKLRDKITVSDLKKIKKNDSNDNLKKIKKHRHNDSSDDSDERHVSNSNKKHKYSDSRSSSDNRKNSSKEYRKRKHHSRSPTPERHYNETRSERPKTKSNKDSRKSRSVSPGGRNYGLVLADGSKVRQNFSVSQFDKSKSKTLASKKVWSKPEREILTAEEKESRLREMMANADVRNKQREDNVKKHNKEKNETQEYKPGFMYNQLIKTTNFSSVESRIKSNINNIQRGQKDMDKHFARKN